MSPLRRARDIKLLDILDELDRVSVDQALKQPDIIRLQADFL